MKAAIFALLACQMFAQDIDKTPAWYDGSKPWKSISKEGRQEMLSLHAGFEAAKREAKTPSSSRVSQSDAAKGEDLVRKTIKRFRLDHFYETPSIFGKKMVLWIPEKAWNAFTESEKRFIEAYVKSKYQNWGIGVGRIKGSDVLSDRIVKES
jgi:hypothetical protein